MKHNFPRKISLNSNWKFTFGKSAFNSSLNKDLKLARDKYFAAEVPGTIHTDLINNKIIDDPFYADNELKLEWIAKSDWIYKTSFHMNDSRKYNLVLEGIDSAADVYVNDKKILSCNNMFISYKIDVEKYLKRGENELKIYFHSPVNYAEKEEKKNGKLPVALNSSRVYIRKAQYSFGWDWGPSFPTSGIYKDIYLEEKCDVDIKDVLFKTISISKNSAKVSVTATIKTNILLKTKLQIKLKNSNNIFKKVLPAAKSGMYKTDFEITDPQLWWPSGEGKQNLYIMSLEVTDDENTTLKSFEKKVGIRKIKLIEKEKNRNTFKLRVNGLDIYAKGVNWIPADSFLPRVKIGKYSKLLHLAKDANMNIIRVWGGGVYENDEFYQMCDRLGLLVWQDFMFACGAYPENKEFIDSVKEEITQNTVRLQHHPSIAVWCGNNENEWIWYQEQQTSYKKMPGYKIYHRIIPDILKNIDESLIYWPSSPFSYEDDPNSFNSGNTHQWDIWSRWVDYENVNNDKSLFVTEFGFQGPANKDTFEKYLPKNNRKVSDKVFDLHNKQVEGPERIIKFMSAHLPVNTNWNDYLYLAQLNQGFALKTCLEHWRTNGTANGSIIWQINDCWPVSSWAVVDSELKPKIAYHFVKNSFSKQLVYFTEKNNTILLNVQNQSKVSFSGKLIACFIDAPTGRIKNRIERKIKLGGNIDNTFESFDKEGNINERVFLFSELFDQKGNLISSNYYKTFPWKYYKTAEAGISIKILNKNGKTKVVVSSRRPAYFVDLYAKGFDFSRRCFTILPGEKTELDVSNYNGRKLKLSDMKIYSLNKYLK